MRITRRMRALLRDTRATTAIEYGLIAAIMAVACIGAFHALADQVSEIWAFINDVTGNNM